MSALGQKRTFGPFITMSALPPKADIVGRELDVRFVPKADMPVVGDCTLSPELISAHNSAMNILRHIFWQEDGPIEERIGNLIGKIFVLILTTCFVWAYWPAVAAQLGLLR
jgi:hypothetical protein